MMHDDVGDPSLLMRSIIARSTADTWEMAKLEWRLIGIEMAEEYGEQRCLCGHAIKEMCWLHNTTNDNTALVGNVCVTRFIGIRSDLVFDGLRRILQDSSKAPNDELTAFAYQQHWINEWEYSFLSSTSRKRRLSSRQQDTRLKINQKIIDSI